MPKETGYECFNCGHKTVYWSADFDFADYGYEGEGIIHECRCYNCGAEITYAVPAEKPYPKAISPERLIERLEDKMAASITVEDLKEELRDMPDMMTGDAKWF